MEITFEILKMIKSLEEKEKSKNTGETAHLKGVSVLPGKIVLKNYLLSSKSSNSYSLGTVNMLILRYKLYCTTSPSWRLSLLGRNFKENS